MKLTANVAIAILRASATNDWQDLIASAISTLENIAIGSYEYNLPQHIVDLGVNTGKIAAVKQIRAETGFSLATTMGIVNTYFTKNNLKFKGEYQ